MNFLITFLLEKVLNLKTIIFLILGSILMFFIGKYSYLNGKNKEHKYLIEYFQPKVDSLVQNNITLKDSLKSDSIIIKNKKEEILVKEDMIKQLQTQHFIVVKQLRDRTIEVKELSKLKEIKTVDTVKITISNNYNVFGKLKNTDTITIVKKWYN